MTQKELESFSTAQLQKYLKAINQELIRREQQQRNILNSPQDIKHFLEKKLSQDEVNWYGSKIPDTMSDLYADPEKRPFIEYFIEQEIQDAKDNQELRT